MSEEYIAQLESTISELEAEVSSLSIDIKSLEWEVNNKETTIEELKEEINNVYQERNKVLAGWCRTLIDSGYRVERWKDDSESLTDDWRNVIAIYVANSEIPSNIITHFISNSTYQLSWHIHESELYLFDFVPLEKNQWDGHDTEEKYKRLEGYVTRKKDIAE